MRKSEYNKARNHFLSKNYTDGCVPDDSKIIVFHVGGRGGLGHSVVFKNLGIYVDFVFFEANLDESEESQKFENHMSLLEQNGCGIELHNKCIAGSCGQRKFYINEAPTSSSLLKTNPRAGKYWHRHHHLWRSHSKVNKCIDVETITFDSLRHSGQVQESNFFTLDVQGAEYEILNGSKSYLGTDVLGMVVETEFFPIYKDQPLFNEIFSFLTKQGFLFFDFVHIQSWHVNSHNWKAGQTVVSESLFLKDFECLSKRIENKSHLALHLMKLARIALCFNRDSYAFEILNFVSQEYPNILDRLLPMYADQFRFYEFVRNKSTT